METQQQLDDFQARIDAGDKIEPKEAFHYRPPDDIIKENYAHIFNLKKPLKQEKLESNSFHSNL